MKFISTLFLSFFLFLGVNAQTLVSCTAAEGASGNCNLGSEITNGQTGGGCAGACAGSSCGASGTGNHSLETMTTVLAIPAGHSALITIVTNNCDVSSGIDGGDDVIIDGVVVVDGAGNLQVNYSGCHEGAADGSGVTVELKANRRDETVNVSWTSGPTDGGAGNGCHSIVLPAELMNFQARKRRNDIRLLWTTASEVNNSFFEIEHAIDGSNYKVVGRVEGNGNSTEQMDYSFSHSTPSNGFNYYRLKQVDFDGGFEYSNVISIRNDDNNKINIYPSQASDAINVDFGSAIDKEVEIHIFDNLGRLISTSNVAANEFFKRIDISSLQNGTYYIHMNYNGIVTKRIVKI